MMPLEGNWEAIRAWRRQTRQAFLAARTGLSRETRAHVVARIKARLREAVDLSRFPSLGLYWPIKGEIDLRDLAREFCERGGIVALPVVTERAKPVEFWRWQPGTRMTRGLWDIPVPAERDPLMPAAAIVPLVGFDAQRYRLGYGGGYYDRTLATASPRPWCVGIGFSATRLASIHPQPHDIPMDLIVTDEEAIG
jgi:5-formyltetrahydrofolate cyclo-ligase